MPRARTIVIPALLALAATWPVSAQDANPLDPAAFSQPDPQAHQPSISLSDGWFVEPGDVAADAAQLQRWQREAQAGRAMAAYLAANALLDPKNEMLRDCARGLALLRRAQELGGARADFGLGMYFASSPCVKAPDPQAQRFLRQAVERGNAQAAMTLGTLHLEGPADLRDPALASAYVDFAWKTYHLPIAGLAPGPREMQARALAEKIAPQLTVEQMRGADTLSAQLREKSSAYFHLLANSESARTAIIVEPVSASQPLLFRYRVRLVDDTGECFENLVHNCAGVPRSLRVEISNAHTTHLQCRVSARSRAFAGVALDAQRLLWVAPGRSRDLHLGIAQAEVTPADVRVSCAPIEVDAATGRPDVCGAVSQRTINPADFYPYDTEGYTEGAVVVRVLVLGSGQSPVDVEVTGSAHDEPLDSAAIATVRAEKFTTLCKYGTSKLKVTFKRE